MVRGRPDYSHSYAAAGVYTVTVTVTDDDDGSDLMVYQYVVIYDPTAGFVTGGGWIDSPLSAYPADPTLIGKANFGFVSKYAKGATVPTGQTEFKVADLNFRSSTYQWLVVAGKCQVQRHRHDQRCRELPVHAHCHGWTVQR